MALDSQRLDRIEEKIDKLSDAVIAILVNSAYQKISRQNHPVAKMRR